MALEDSNIVCQQEREKMENNELPDSIISYIFSKLDTKDMAKTSVLSKRWRYEWLYMMDMDFRFDMYDVFDLSQITSEDDFLNVVDKFCTTVHECIKNYKGSKIGSIRVCFPIGDPHISCFIGSLISHGAAKGVERIELLLFRGNGTYHVPFESSCKLANCDSLKYLHLQQCYLVLPVIDFSGFKNLQTLVLQEIVFERDILLRLFSHYIHLEKVTLLECFFDVKHHINIISSKLCHLVIIDCRHVNWRCTFKITIDAVNLLSFEYSCPIRLSSIKAPRLLKFFWGTIIDYRQKILSPFAHIARLDQIENLVLSFSHSHVRRILLTNLGPFQNVKRIEISIYGEYPHYMGYLHISDIVMASPNLQKLVLKISHPHYIFPNMATYLIEKRKHTRFSYNQLKYVELHGCIGPMNAIELTRHFLKNANSLKQITFNPRGRFYKGAEKWSDSFECSSCMGCNLVREMLKDEVNEQCRLVIL